MSNFSHNSAETFYLQIKLISCAYHCEKSTVMIAPNQVFGYGNLRKIDSYCWNISKTKDPSGNIFSKICRLHSIVWLMETNYSGKQFRSWQFQIIFRIRQKNFLTDHIIMGANNLNWEIILIAFEIVNFNFIQLTLFEFIASSASANFDHQQPILDTNYLYQG